MARLSNEGRESQEIDRLLGLPPTVKNDEQADEFAGYTKCGRCRGSGYEPTRRRAVDCSLRDWPIACAACKGACYVDLPTGPTTAVPGSLFKQAVLAARYATGIPLWDPGDAYDHSRSFGNVRRGQGVGNGVVPTNDAGLGGLDDDDGAECDFE